MIEARIHSRLLKFDRPRGTSRGWLDDKPAYYIALKDLDSGYIALGECGLLPKLSIDDRPDFRQKLDEVAAAITDGLSIPNLSEWPAIRFAVEMAFAELKSRSKATIIANTFSGKGEGIEINGLVWMGNKDEMRAEIDQKIRAGYTCIKLKIGAIDFGEELALIGYIRKLYRATDLAIRVDANGAFSAKDAPRRLAELARLNVESIEQPIRQGQWEAMAALCADSPLAIALDEELITAQTLSQKRALISEIKPQALVMKPSLLGGFAACDEWISIADAHGAYWWITSALESNVGLNAIAQYTSSKNPSLPQGLGTGMLYTNNIGSPLEIRSNHLYYNRELNWEIPSDYVGF